jgi:hypothetical protein
MFMSRVVYCQAKGCDKKYTAQPRYIELARQKRQASKSPGEKVDGGRGSGALALRNEAIV